MKIVYKAAKQEVKPELEPQRGSDPEPSLWKSLLAAFICITSVFAGMGIILWILLKLTTK